MDDRFKDVIEHLHAFFREMREWQIMCRRVSDEEDVGTISHKEATSIMMGGLRLIYDRYCEYRVFPNSVTFTYDPAYDVEKEEILEVFEAKGKVIVITDRKTILPRIKLKYTIQRVKEGYRILMNRKRFNEYKNTWVSWDLLL